MKEMMSPHFGERTTPIEMIVLHCSAYPLEQCAGIWNQYEVSPHYVVEENGTMTKMVNEQDKAYHCGVGFWRGRDGNLNTYSVGIEILNMSLGQDAESYREEQIEKLIPFIKKLMKKYNIDPRNVVGHSDVAPKRKADPGLAFPWKRLAKEGIGVWYQPRNAEKMPENNVAELLAKIGYDTRDEEAVIASAYAFRRHYLPGEVVVDQDILHLVDNVYPVGEHGLLQGEKFIQTLKATAYHFENFQENMPAQACLKRKGKAR